MEMRRAVVARVRLQTEAFEESAQKRCKVNTTEGMQAFRWSSQRKVTLCDSIGHAPDMVTYHPPSGTTCVPPDVLRSHSVREYSAHQEGSMKDHSTDTKDEVLTDVGFHRGVLRSTKNDDCAFGSTMRPKSQVHCRVASQFP